jgi:hypothetical protein
MEYLVAIISGVGLKRSPSGLNVSLSLSLGLEGAWSFSPRFLTSVALIIG